MTETFCVYGLKIGFLVFRTPMAMLFEVEVPLETLLQIQNSILEYNKPKKIVDNCLFFKLYYSI